jgi:hypothetical protein
MLHATCQSSTASRVAAARAFHQISVCQVSHILDDPVDVEASLATGEYVAVCCWLEESGCLCRRVKAQARYGSPDPDGTTILLDADDEDQSHQFPFGC